MAKDTGSDSLREKYFGRAGGRQRPAPSSVREALSDIGESITTPIRALVDTGAGLARSSTAATFGAPADILNLLRVKSMGGKDIPYGYEYFMDLLPSAGGKQETKTGEALGQFVPLPSRVATAPLKAVAAIPGAIKHGAKEFAKASALGAPHVMRPRGSQTIDTGLKDELSKFYRRQNPEGTLADLEARFAGEAASPEAARTFENAINALKQEVAIKNWVQGPLAKYIKRDMGTPEDPVRLLAEEGITHREFPASFAQSSSFQGMLREKAGFPRMGMGVSPEARRFENVADYAVGEPYVVGHPETAEAFELAGNQMPDWMAKLPEGTNVYAPGTTNMGFDHIIDVLREDLATGRIRPDQLSKVSMEQAVRRTFEYDQELLAKMTAEKAAFRAGLPVHREYPTGFRWIELNKPGSFAAESDAMGHSVRGYEPPKGHPDWVEASGDSGSASYGHGGWEAIKSGRAKVYSLIDDQGRPHATVEVKANDVPEAIRNMPHEERQALKREVIDKHFGGDSRAREFDKFWKLVDEAYLEKYGPPPAKITQIKGKQNTRPVEEYQPYIADFVRQGNWQPQISDLHHTDLVKMGTKLVRQPELDELYRLHGFDDTKSVYTGEGLTKEGMAEERTFHLADIVNKDPALLTENERNLLDAAYNFEYPTGFVGGGSVKSKKSAGPEFRAREEKFPLLGATGRVLQSVDEFARKPFGYENPPAAIISDLMQIPALTRTIENINYGSPLTYGTGQARQLTPDTKGAAEAALNLAPAAGPLVRATKNIPIGMVVKPVGNLNLRPSVLATALKGPEKQKVGDFIKQIDGMKGLTKEGKEGALASLKAMDQNQVVTKQFVEDSFTPSRYNIVDLKGAADDASAHLETEAQRMVEEDPEIYEKFAEYAGLAHQPESADVLGNLLFYARDPDRLKGTIVGMPEALRKQLFEMDILSSLGPDARVNRQVINSYFDEFQSQRVDAELEYLRMHYQDLVSPSDYSYRDYQRLVDADDGYVEKGVAHPDAPLGYRHFPESDEPLTAHFRGTGGGSSAVMPWRTGRDYFDLDPNSFVIEELQSDAAKRAGSSGILHQPHATAFKAAVQHALEQGHDTVYMPTARTIALVRGRPAESFAPIYDQEVVNYGIAPLSRMKGVEVEPIMFEDVGEGLAPAYHKIKISPEARKELLEGQGQPLPGFASGGSVEASPFEGLEPTFGNRMGAYISDKITEAGINLYDMLANREGMSAAHKIYLDTFARGKRDPITAKDFDEAELAELQNIIAQKEAATGARGRGSIQYKDYDELPGGDRRKATGASLIGGRMPPRPSLSKSLGQFGYERNPKTGEYRIVDEYDFNPQQITYEGRKVNVPVEHYGDYVSNTLSPYELARLYAGRKMPPGTGRKVDLSITVEQTPKKVKKADGGSVDLRTKYFGTPSKRPRAFADTLYMDEATSRIRPMITDGLPRFDKLDRPTLNDFTPMELPTLEPVEMIS